MATIIGTNGDDHLTGTSGADLIIGLLGDDTIAGGKGADQIDAGGGDDTITYRAGDGNDLIDGGSGFDHAYLDLRSLPGETYTFAAHAPFSDITDIAWFGQHGDRVSVAGTEVVHVAAGDGNDTFHFRSDPTADVQAYDLSTGGGHDRIEAHNADADVQVDASDSAGTLFVGGFGNDGFFGSLGADQASGGQGNDFLSSGGGSGDSLNGGPGEDELFVASGQARVTTGPGTDTVEPYAFGGRDFRVEITDFNVKQDGVGFVDSRYDFSALDTNGDGQVDAGDKSVHDTAAGLQVGLGPLSGNPHEVLVFDHLHSVPVHDFFNI